jgi:hypothetical protein
LVFKEENMEEVWNDVDWVPRTGDRSSSSDWDGKEALELYVWLKDIFWRVMRVMIGNGRSKWWVLMKLLVELRSKDFLDLKCGIFVKKLLNFVGKTWRWFANQLVYLERYFSGYQVVKSSIVGL